MELDSNNSWTPYQSQTMNVSESIALWNMKTQKDAWTMYEQRIKNEIISFSRNKSNLYSTIYKMDDGLVTQDEINEAEEYIHEMNNHLRSAHELYLHGQKTFKNFDKNPNMFLVSRFLNNFVNGYYDKCFNELSSNFQEKILKSTEL